MASNLIGQHVQIGDAQSLQRIQAYGAATSRVFDPGSAAGRGAAVMGSVLRSMASTQAVIDGFIAIGFLSAVAVLLLVLHKAAPPGPATARPLFTPPVSPP